MSPTWPGLGGSIPVSPRRRGGGSPAQPVTCRMPAGWLAGWLASRHADGAVPRHSLPRRPATGKLEIGDQLVQVDDAQVGPAMGHQELFDFLLTLTEVTVTFTRRKPIRDADSFILTPEPPMAMPTFGPPPLPRVDRPAGRPEQIDVVLVRCVRIPCCAPSAGPPQRLQLSGKAESNLTPPLPPFPCTLSHASASCHFAAQA